MRKSDRKPDLKKYPIRLTYVDDDGEPRTMHLTPGEARQLAEGLSTSSADPESWRMAENLLSAAEAAGGAA